MFFRKNKIVVYTAIFGDKDELIAPINKIKNADLICFTDNPKNRARQYKTIVRKPEFDDSNRSAKRYKVLGDDLLNKYEYSIWIDGKFHIKFNDAQKVIEEALLKNNDDLALMSHPQRDCIYEEYEFIKSVNPVKQLDNQEIMDNQISRYKKEGFPKHFGLIGGGFILRKIDSVKAKKIMQAWWNEISNNSRRDQLSFNYILWKLKEKITIIPGIYWDNGYFKVIGRKPKQ